MNKKALSALLICGATVLCVVLFFLAPYIKSTLKHAISVSDDMIVSSTKYQTTDLSNYGKYTGNYDNHSVREFITSFFPDSIRAEFSDVTYSYRAQKWDSYAFEAYLEFTIEDPQAYQLFVESHTQNMDASVFMYDDKFTEYTISDVFIPLNWNENTSDLEHNVVHISQARIGKILCSHDDQKIIFIALGVWDGGVAGTDFLNVFFTRFKINPQTYAENLSSTESKPTRQ